MGPGSTGGEKGSPAGAQHSTPKNDGLVALCNPSSTVVDGAQSRTFQSALMKDTQQSTGRHPPLRQQRPESGDAAAALAPPAGAAGQAWSALGGVVAHW